MDLEKKISELFKKIGLGEPSIKTYLSLIYLGGKATADQIIAHTGLPASSVYKALKNLEEHGLVMTLATKPRMFIVIPPNKKLNMLIEERMKKLLELSKEVSTAIEHSITGVHAFDTVFSIVDGWEDILRMAKFMIKTAENEVLVFMPKNIIFEVAEELGEALDRNIYVSLVASNTISGRHPKTIYGYSGIATISRERPHGTRILIITDSKTSLIVPLSPGDQTIYIPRATYIEDIELGFILTSYFYNRIVASSIEVYSNVKPGDRYVFKNIQSAVDFIQHALQNRYEVYAKVKGYMTAGLTEVALEGIVYNIVSNPTKGIYSILLDTGGNVYSVGGYRAFMEDVMAKEIMVEVKDIAGDKK